MSLYALLTRPGEWSGAICMSGAWWVKEGFGGWAALQLAKAPPSRIWLDAGTIDDGLDETQAMKQALLGAGLKEDAGLGYYEHIGGKHEEASWKARVHLALEFLFDPKNREKPFG
jgi:predicted alpha/beta superfamily hydrolase